MLFADPIRYTETEAAMIGRLAQVRALADAGNRRAKAQIAQVARQMAAFQKQAKRGNAKAARAAQVLEESGLLVSSQTFAMEGALDNINVWNVVLLAAFGGLALKRRWGWAMVPAGVFVAREGRGKRWW
jgi:hypothetical protein